MTGQRGIWSGPTGDYSHRVMVGERNVAAVRSGAALDGRIFVAVVDSIEADGRCHGLDVVERCHFSLHSALAAAEEMMRDRGEVGGVLGGVR